MAEVEQVPSWTLQHEIELFRKNVDIVHWRVPIWRNTEIDLFSQRNAAKLYTFWRTLTIST